MEKSTLQLLRASLWAMSLVICISITSFGQVSGTISGTVTDATAAILPGVEVTATNVATALARTVITNESGVYVIPLLPVGGYRVTAVLPGFQTAVREGIELNTDDRIAVNFALEVGAITSEILVTESAPLIQSETSEIGAVIENQRIVELPLNGRQFEQLALLVPGTFTPAPGSSNGFRGGISIAGARERDTGFFIDGINMVDTITSSVIFRPSVDMIQEFKVHTSRYSAEVGRNAGGHITVTTKSGGNELHGSVYEFVRNDKFDAKNFFDPADEPIPPFTRNQFGGTIGGPIVRDRTFFFGNYEGLRLNQSITKTATVPSAAMKRGDFSELGTPIIDPFTGQQFPGNIIPADRIAPIGQASANWYPDPNLPGSVRNFVSTPVDDRVIDQFTIKINHRFSENNNFFGRYSWNDDVELDPFDVYNGITNLPGYGRQDIQKAQSISLVDNHVFSPNLVAEFRLGYNRFTQIRSVYPENQRDIPAELGIPGTTKNPVNFGFPTFRVTGFDTLGKSGLPSDRDDNHYQTVGNMTWTRGNHTFKFGYDVSWQQSDRINNSNSRGVFRYSGQYTGNAMADLLMGFPRATSRTIGESRAYPSSWLFGHFFQDDWKITPRLTLNLGVRYDWQTNVISTTNRWSRFNTETGNIEIVGTADVRRDISRPDNPISTNYSPALEELAKTVTFVDLGRRDLVKFDRNDVAPRIGLAYDVLDNDSLVLRMGYGVYFNLHELRGFGGDTYPFKVGQSFNANRTVPNIFIHDPFPDSLSRATISPRSVGDRHPTMYVQQYNFGFQYQAGSDLMIDIGYVGNKSTNLPERRDLNQVRPCAPPCGSVASRRPYQGFGSIRHSEGTGLANFNSLQMRVEKRSVGGLALAAAYTYSKSIDLNSAGASGGRISIQDNYNIRQGMRGPSGFDARQRLVVSYVYELPFGSGQRFLSNARGFANWFVSGWEFSGIQTFQSGRPFSVRITSDNSNTGARSTDRPHLVGDVNLPGGQRTLDRWFNTDAYIRPARGTFGNAGRNNVIGPGLNNSDLSLIKNSRFGEELNFQFRAEFFNAFNHPNFDFPNRNFGTKNFGRIFAAQFSRQIQFGFKFIF